MRTYALILISIASALLECSLAWGQDPLLKRGDRYYEAFSFAQAISTYEQAFRKDASSIEHARRLADSYWTLRDHQNAEKWYAIVASSSQAEAEDIYRYAELLRLTGQYADSDRWMKRFAQLSPTDSRVRLKENAVERLASILESEGMTHKVVRSNLSSDQADIAPFIKGDSIIFASARVEQFTSRHIHSWNDQPFLNLYVGKLDGDGNIRSVKPMGHGTNTHYHESNLVVSHDGSELYFTRNNIVNGRKVLSEEGINNLQIFMRRRTSTGWSKDIPFPYNSASHSVGHPAIDKEGARLFFTSDMPGGVGGKDLYVCYRNDDGGWGEPVNLGRDINTEGDEMFPFVHENQLYFSSDGHMGLGGLDLFRSTIRGRHYGAPENLGAPINSLSDDFALCLDENGDMGFFTSDRDGALTTENIYSFRKNSKSEDDRVWHGKVLDLSDALPVPQVPVRLLDIDGRELASTVTGLNGRYQFPAPRVKAYVQARIPGGGRAEILASEITPSLYGDTELPDMYINSVMDLPVNAIVRDAVTDDWLDGVTVLVKDARNDMLLFHGVTNEMGITQGQIPDLRFGDDANFEVTFSRTGYLARTVRVDLRVLMFLEQALTGPQGTTLTPIGTGIDMAKAMNLRPIYFDYREHAIRPDAAEELDLVASVLEQDHSIRIDLRSHTDSRASTEYNDLLSQRRAESSRSYLIRKGIDPVRITCKGYGERQLVNECDDDVPCSEEQHQANRRTEFIITSCKDCPDLKLAGL